MAEEPAATPTNHEAPAWLRSAKLPKEHLGLPDKKDVKDWIVAPPATSAPRPVANGGRGPRASSGSVEPSCPAFATRGKLPGRS